MRRLVLCFVMGVGFLALVPLAALAQQDQEPVYTFVALWDVPGPQRAEAVAALEKQAKPLLERLMAEGTVVDWGIFATVVHEPDGYTHGVWYSIKTSAAMDRVRAEVAKMGPIGPLATARHRDWLFRSIVYKSSPASGSGAKLWVSLTKVEPGRGRDWRELWVEHNKPFYDEMVTNKLLTYYSVQVEDVHTEDSGWRWVVSISPNAEAVDKLDAAENARSQKRGAVMNRTIGAAFSTVTTAGAHRDYAADVLFYATK